MSKRGRNYIIFQKCPNIPISILPGEGFKIVKNVWLKSRQLPKKKEQAGAELCQAQLKLRLDFN